MMSLGSSACYSTAGGRPPQAVSIDSLDSHWVGSHSSQSQFRKPYGAVLQLHTLALEYP